jgi:hypothetical protein
MINLNFPSGWEKLTDKQLFDIFKILAQDKFSFEETMFLLLIKWNEINVVGRTHHGRFLLSHQGRLFIASTRQIAELMADANWLKDFPKSPVRLKNIGPLKARDPKFNQVPFSVFIYADNIYQGYMHTGDENLLNFLTAALYDAPDNKKFNRIFNVNSFYWFASLKIFLTERFNDLFQKADQDSGALGKPSVRKSVYTN